MCVQSYSTVICSLMGDRFDTLFFERYQVMDPLLFVPTSALVCPLLYINHTQIDRSKLYCHFMLRHTTWHAIDNVYSDFSICYNTESYTVCVIFTDLNNRILVITLKLNMHTYMHHRFPWDLLFLIPLFSCVYSSVSHCPFIWNPGKFTYFLVNKPSYVGTVLCSSLNGANGMCRQKYLSAL